MAFKQLIYKVSQCCTTPPENFTTLKPGQKGLPKWDWKNRKWIRFLPWKRVQAMLQILGSTTQPSGYDQTVIFPKVTSFEYTLEDGVTVDNSKVEYVINTTWDGSETDYVEASIDESEVNADGTLKGTLDITVDCQELCRQVEYKSFWQTGGVALQPYRRAVSVGGYSGGCGKGTVLGRMAIFSSGMGLGQAVRFTLFGGIGPLRFFRSNGPAIARAHSPNTPLTGSGYSTYVDGLAPELNDKIDHINTRMQNGYKDVKTEYHIGLDDLPNITIKAVKPGIAYLTATDGVACVWYIVLSVYPSYCAEHSGDITSKPTRKAQILEADTTGAVPKLTGDEFPDENTMKAKFGQIIRRNQDMSIPFVPSDEKNVESNWCNCETGANLKLGAANFKFGPKNLKLTDSDYKVIGRQDDLDQYSSDNNLILNDGNLVTQGGNTEFVSTSVLVNTEGKAGNIYRVNPVLRHAAMYVGQKVKINIPNDVWKDDDDEPMDWDVEIIDNHQRTTLIPSMNESDLLDEKAEGSGWTAENTGPAAYTKNNERSLWKVRVYKKRGYFTLESLAPTNFLPTTFMVYPKSSTSVNGVSLKKKSMEQWFTAAVPNKHLMLSVADTLPGGSVGTDSSWALRKHDKLSDSGDGSTDSTKYIQVTQSSCEAGESTQMLTSAAQLINVWGFCPPAEWEVLGHSECSFTNGLAKQKWTIPRTPDHGTLDVKMTMNYQELGGAEVLNKFPSFKTGNKIKFGVPHVYVKGQEPYNDDALFDNQDFSSPDEVGEHWAQKNIKINTPTNAGKMQMGSAVIFGFVKLYASNQAKNSNPYYKQATTNRGIFSDEDTWFYLGDGDKTFSQPFSKPGSTMKNPIQSTLKEKWGGAYEQLRGAVCMYSTSETNTLKMAESDIKRVFMVDKNGKVVAMKDDQNNVGLVGGGDAPNQCDPCA